MRLTTFILIIALAQVSARGFGQKITLNEINAPIEKILQSIQSQSGYGFIYNVKDLDNRKVSISLNNASIEEAVKSLVKDLRLNYKIVNKDIVLTRIEPSFLDRLVERWANIDVSGRVVDEKGLPLSGATIKIKGTERGTRTNTEGSFVLTNVDENAILQIGFLGYKTKEIKAAKNLGNISMEVGAGELDEIEITANTGYQKVKPNEINGAVTVIDNKTLNEQAGTNILSRLQSVTSGLTFNPGYSGGNSQRKTEINIRGLSTINASLDPLIVLDNFIFEGDLVNINPNDIESITILKDAAASSIWGARAGNGVIVITTKKGKFNQKLKVSTNASVLVTQKPDLSATPEMSVSDLIDFEQFLFGKGYFNSTINQPYAPLTPAVEVFLERRNNKISANDSASKIDALKQLSTREQYEKYFYQTAITQQYSVNLRGGTNNLAWLISGAYDRNMDNLSAFYDKKNFRVNNSYKPTKNLRVDVSVYYTGSKSINGKPPYQNASTINGRYVPYLQFADASGNPLAVTNQYRTSYIDTAGAGKLLDWRYYPLEDYKHNKGITKLDEIIASAGLNYQFIPELNLDIQYQQQQQRSTTEALRDLQSFETRNTINLFSQLDRATGRLTRIVPLGDIFQIRNAKRQSQNFRGQLNYAHRFGDHHLSAMAGGELREVVGSSNGAIYYGYKKDPLSFANIDNVNRYPTFITGSQSTISGASALQETTNRFVAIYSNLSYTLKERYSLSGSIRKDGSNIFGVSTNDKWKPLWSAGLGWELSKEKFYNNTFLPYIKLRATTGYSGNVDLSRTALPLAGSGIDPNSNLPIASINTLNNPDLRWEKVRQRNIGLDFRFKQSIISGSIDYYTKKGTDLYGETPYDYTTWGASSSIVKNVAAMKGHGIDIVINTINTNGRVKWATGLLYNYNISKTTAYYEKSAETITTLIGGGRNISPVIGKPLYAIAAYKWGGLDNTGYPQGYLDGELSTNYSAIVNQAREKGLEGGNIVYFGSSIPTSFGSLINTITWKQASVSINVAYKMGYYFRKTTLSYEGIASNGRGHKEYADRWRQPGDESFTNVPSFVYPFNFSRDGFYGQSSINVLKGDHIRLQYVNLNYNLAGNKKNFDNIQMYLNVANLGILWKANKYGIDPEYPYVTPLPKTFAFGVRADF